MRWPLRNQILVRLLLLLLVTISVVTLANIRSVIQANRNRELGQLAELGKLLRQSSFPLSDTVLENMKSLSGAEFILQDANGNLLARTSTAPVADRPQLTTPTDTLSKPPREVVADGVAYYYQVVKQLDLRTVEKIQHFVHIYVPRQTSREVWWQASKSPLLIAALILPIAWLLGLALSNQVTRPLSDFRGQVLDIAEGKLEQIPVVSQNNEIGDLQNSINEMAIRLQDHDRQIRQNERLNALVHLGNGIAHHLRNSATGCKLAIELLAEEQTSVAGSENFQVATRQLEIMNSYIKKFWLLSQPSTPISEPSVQAVDLAGELLSVEFLVRRPALHLNVELSVKIDAGIPSVRMDHDDVQQIMLNLINNALTAASQYGASLTGGKLNATVDVCLVQNSNGQLVFSVADNGAGPPPEIESEIFEPFVTGSREGTGLGLSLVQEIASRSGSTVCWRRENKLTIFEFVFGSTCTIVAPKKARQANAQNSDH